MNEEQQELIPIEQATLMFYGKPVVVVRLPDGRPAVVIKILCENLQIDTTAQLARIRRTEVIAGDLEMVRADTGGGPQKTVVLQKFLSSSKVIVPFEAKGNNERENGYIFYPFYLYSMIEHILI